jgi:hypothetical protein
MYYDALEVQDGRVSRKNERIYATASQPTHALSAATLRVEGLILALWRIT